MPYENYDNITAERRDRILTLTLNRPDQLNAIDAALHEELSRIFYDVAADDATDVQDEAQAPEDDAEHRQHDHGLDYRDSSGPPSLVLRDSHGPMIAE